MRPLYDSVLSRVKEQRWPASVVAGDDNGSDANGCWQRAFAGGRCQCRLMYSLRQKSRMLMRSRSCLLHSAHRGTVAPRFLGVLRLHHIVERRDGRQEERKRPDCA